MPHEHCYLQKKILFLTIVYYVLFALSLLILYLNTQLYVRPLLYYIVIITMIFIIVVQIFSSSLTTPIGILTKIIFLGINIRWTHLYIYPSLLGIDPFWHQMFTSLILKQGSIPMGYAYSGLPSMHIFIVITTLFTENSYKIASTATVSLIQVLLATLLIYLLGSKIIDKRVGLLGALLFISADWSINLGFAVIPNTFAGVFALFLIYFVMFYMRFVRSKGILLSIVIISVALITSHALTAAWILVIFLCIWVSNQCYDILDSKSNQIKHLKNNYVLIIFIITFIVLLSSWWMYTSGHIRNLVEIFKWTISVSVDDIKESLPTNVLDYQIALPLQEQIIINLGFFLYFGLSLIGCFYLISKDKSGKGFTYAIIGMLTLFIGFLAQLSALINVAQRFWYFAEILLSVPLALSLMLLSEHKMNVNKIIIAMLSCAILGLMIISPIASYDNSFAAPHYSIRYGFFASELTVIDTIKNKSGDATLLSDGYYVSAHNLLEPEDKSWRNIDWQIATKSIHLEKDDLMLLRIEIVTKPVKCLSSIYKLDYDPIQYLQHNSYSKIYNIGTVFGYTM